jgi:hypothetical protein
VQKNQQHHNNGTVQFATVPLLLVQQKANGWWLDARLYLGSFPLPDFSRSDLNEHEVWGGTAKFSFSLCVRSKE